MLKVFQKLDGSRVSSIVIPGKKTRRVVSLSKSESINIFVNPCEDHKSPHPAIKVEIWEHVPATHSNQVVGVGLVCPLCWVILE